MLGFLFLSNVLVAVVGFVTARNLIFLVVRFVAFVVRFVVIAVRLVLSGAGFFAEVFPMSGIDVMCKGLHFGECQRLPLLTHNVFDAFGKSGIVVVPEDTFIPAKGWLKEYQGGPLEIGKHECHLVRVIRVDRIAAEKEIAKIGRTHV